MNEPLQPPNYTAENATARTDDGTGYTATAPDAAVRGVEIDARDGDLYVSVARGTPTAPTSGFRRALRGAPLFVAFPDGTAAGQVTVKATSGTVTFALNWAR